MRTLKYNGENWYYDERNLWKRVRQWVIWIGGWEKANGKGWKFLIDYGDRKRLMSPTPISLLGHSITFYSHGWWQVRLKRRYFVWTKTEVYISSDGTPPDSGDRPKTGFYLFRKKEK